MVSTISKYYMETHLDFSIPKAKTSLFSFSAALLACSNSVNVDLKLLHKWAFEGEKLIHGKPSVTANTVSAYISRLKFMHCC
ncbi:hypothetical protein NC653_035353 [Populus alba x Populus x berolinensis]|uniref:Uncharacterized protein n=1 Tax=Populus alba x Populus x berolinensis TaxID=444605 RepID=A0AAD6LPQ2_9ROSI|nr:hypothetical protein NC653_035353 [Populus alba x Populus x berolinensis]